MAQTPIYTYTIANANGKAGSIVVTSSAAGSSPEYYLNLKNIKINGDNPFLADNVTLNPQASVSLFCLDNNTWLIKNMLMSTISTIGGVATPATLALTLAAIAALIAS